MIEKYVIFDSTGQIKGSGKINREWDGFIKQVDEGTGAITKIPDTSGSSIGETLQRKIDSGLGVIFVSADTVIDAEGWRVDIETDKLIKGNPEADILKIKEEAYNSLVKSDWRIIKAMEKYLIDVDPERKYLSQSLINERQERRDFSDIKEEQLKAV